MTCKKKPLEHNDCVQRAAPRLLGPYIKTIRPVPVVPQVSGASVRAGLLAPPSFQRPSLLSGWHLDKYFIVQGKTVVNGFVGYLFGVRELKFSD